MADRRTALAVAGAALLAGLAGCSGGDSTKPATTSSSTSTGSATGSTMTGGGGKPTSVAVIGDSLTFQNGNGQKDLTAQLVKAGWPAKGICWSGVDGRTVVDTLPGGAPSSQQEVVRCRKQLGEPQVWVIALETNNLGDPPAQLKKDMTKLLGVLGPKANVVWVNAGRQDLDTDQVNKLNPVVKQVLAQHPNTRLADWYGYLKAHPKQTGWWVADGTHMTRTGYAQRNAFIAAQAKAAIPA